MASVTITPNYPVWKAASDVTRGRYLSDSVLFRKDGYAIATNGQMLCAVDATIQGKLQHDVLIPASSVEQAKQIEVDGSDVTLTNRGGWTKTIIAESAAEFPPIADVIPGEKHGGRKRVFVTLGVRELSTLAEAMGDNEVTLGIELEGDGDRVRRAICVAPLFSTTAFGMLMCKETRKDVAADFDRRAALIRKGCAAK